MYPCISYLIFLFVQIEFPRISHTRLVKYVGVSLLLLFIPFTFHVFLLAYRTCPVYVFVLRCEEEKKVPFYFNFCISTHTLVEQRDQEYKINETYEETSFSGSYQGVNNIMESNFSAYTGCHDNSTFF